MKRGLIARLAAARQRRVLERAVANMPEYLLSDLGLARDEFGRVHRVRPDAE